MRLHTHRTSRLLDMVKKRLKEEFDLISSSIHDVVVTVTNLSKNRVEYKSIHDCTYEEFCNWIWISCNYVPFMSLATVDGYEYADGGLACVIPIREAIQRGATEIDTIVLESESMEHNKVLQICFERYGDITQHMNTEVPVLVVYSGGYEPDRIEAERLLDQSSVKLMRLPLSFHGSIYPAIVHHTAESLTEWHGICHLFLS